MPAIEPHVPIAAAAFVLAMASSGFKSQRLAIVAAALACVIGFVGLWLKFG